MCVRFELEQLVVVVPSDGRRDGKDAKKGQLWRAALLLHGEEYSLSEPIEKWQAEAIVSQVVSGLTAALRNVGAGLDVCEWLISTRGQIQVDPRPVPNRHPIPVTLSRQTASWRTEQLRLAVEDPHPAAMMLLDGCQRLDERIDRIIRKPTRAAKPR